MIFAAGSQLSQMMLLAGMILLVWVLVRRNLKMRKANRKVSKDLNNLDRESKVSGAPLADTPTEVLRWQASMFDLQRELKGELDTKIVVVQSLLRQADQKLAQLQAAGVQLGQASSGSLPLEIGQATQVSQLSSEGFSASEIAEKMSLPVAEVELSLSTNPAATPSG